MESTIYNAEENFTAYGDYKIEHDDGRVQVKVVDFPEHESMWVEVVFGDENDGIGKIRNFPFSHLNYGDLVEYSGGTDDKKPQYKCLHRKNSSTPEGVQFPPGEYFIGDLSCVFEPNDFMQMGHNTYTHERNSAGMHIIGDFLYAMFRCWDIQDWTISTGDSESLLDIGASNTLGCVRRQDLGAIAEDIDSNTTYGQFVKFDKPFQIKVDRKPLRIGDFKFGDSVSVLPRKSVDPSSNVDRPHCFYMLYTTGSIEQEYLTDEQYAAFDGSDTPGGDYCNLVYYWTEDEWSDVRYAIAGFDT